MMLTDDFKVMISKMFVAVENKDINKLNNSIKYVIKNLKYSEINDFSEYLIKRIEVLADASWFEEKKYKHILTEILNCLIKANYKDHTITDTLWITDFCTLFDYIANSLNIDDFEKYINEVLADE